MGFKRPFDNEEFPELPCKHLRQPDYSNMRTPFAELVPSNNGPQQPIFSGEVKDAFRKFQWHEELEKDTVSEVSNLVDKDLETNEPLSSFSVSSSEEDVGSGTSAYSSLSPEYFEVDFPRRTVLPSDNDLPSFLDRYPRKQVPLGSAHQASIPLWGKHVNKNKLDLTENINPSTDDGDSKEKLMGTCVIPMPDSNLSTDKGCYAGYGRTACDCLDSGSIRCVRQHVMEAREKLRKSIGDDKFVNLGFSDIGEEVAYKWTEEEEQIFHEVVYSNPASLGRNFWKHLSMVFPSQSKRELVSYYFNVFMLWRRAAQNRSKFLDIDSDDDEWHGNNRGSYEVGDSEEDEDSAIISLADQDNQVDSSSEDDCSSDDDDDDNDGGGEGCCREDVPGEDDDVDLMPEAQVLKSHDESKFDQLVQHVDKTPGDDQRDLYAQDDSCLSFDCQANMSSSCGPVNNETALQVCGVNSEHGKRLHSEADWCSDAVGQFYLLEPCDAKVWDARCPSASLKNFDLSSTGNMIEEIFGEGTADNKKRGD